MYCEQIVAKGVRSVVEDSLCDAEGEERPRAQRDCDEEEKSKEEEEEEEGVPKFHGGPWGGCSALCGEGTRKRTVTCYQVKKNVHCLS